ncbi:MAG: hypothetical protein ACRC1D_03580 [Culicoidibacterales bacterium]
MKDLVPRGGVKYDDAKNEAQQIANKTGKTIRLWFNVGKGKMAEIIKPIKNT